MPRPFPAAAGLAFPLAGCGPNDVLISALQYGGNFANAAMNSLHDDTDQDEPIDREAMRARSQVCVEQKLAEADFAQLMAQTETTIELVYRIQSLEQAANPANIVTGM